MNNLSVKPRPVAHLNQVDLARRWKLSPRTLKRWRWQGTGPAWLKLGGRVAYRLEDVEAWEVERLRPGDGDGPVRGDGFDMAGRSAAGW